MRGFIDESVREAPDGSFYVLGAAVTIGGAEDEARGRLRALLLRRQQRLHWHAESDARRLSILSVLADLELGVFAAWCHPVGRRHQERARRSCLTALAGDLSREGISGIVLEHRDEAGDRADRRTLLDARHGDVAALNYRFAHAVEEPLLWAADAVVGAVGAHLVGSTDRYYEALRPAVLVIRRTRLD